MSLEQLKNFCQFETDFGTENKTHIAQWALEEIERKDAALRAALDALEVAFELDEHRDDGAYLEAIHTIKDAL